MKQHYPGQAALTRHAGLILLVACDEPQNLALGKVTSLSAVGFMRLTWRASPSRW